MPMVNAVKKFVGGGIYHVYNRGVNGEDIFLSEEDFGLFIWLLARYLTKPGFDSFVRKNFYGRIELLAFCLLSNHIHLLLKQKSERDISDFMHSLNISFTLFVNKRHGRFGHLFQGVYKARLILNDGDLMNVSKYIHLNNTERREGALNYPYSSLGVYLSGSSGFPFVYSKTILDLFGQSRKSYEDYLFGCDSIVD